MKVLLVQPFAHKEGHQPVYTKSLGEALAAQGQTVQVVTYDGFIVPVDSKLKISSVCAEADHWSTLLQLINKLLRLKKLLNLDSFFISFLTLRLAMKKLAEEHFDVVHVIDANPFPLSQLYFAKKMIGLKTVFDIHFPLELSYIAENYGLGLSNTYYRWYSLNKARATIWLLSSRIFGSKYAVTLYEKWVKSFQLGKGPFFVCHTQHNKNSYSETMLRNIVVIHSGTTTSTGKTDKIAARRKLNLPQNKKILLCFGVNHREKSYLTVFEALKMFSPGSLKTLLILFVGRIDHSLIENDPAILVQRYSLPDTVKIYDAFISEADVESFFAASDFVLLSYSKQFSCSSMVLAQAFQFKIPVLASNVGQIGAQVTKYGIGETFEPEDPLSLSNALRSILTYNQEEMIELKRNLTFLASKYSWKNTARAHIDFYNRIRK